MTETSAEVAAPQGDPLIPVAELAKIAGCSSRYIYLLAQQEPEALPLDPKHKGVPMSKALSWLRSRDAKKAGRDAAVRRLREAYESARATEGAT